MTQTVTKDPEMVDLGLGILLRPPQAEALIALKKHYDRGENGFLFSLPTGVGKAYTAILSKKYLGIQGTTLFLAHSGDLIKQAKRSWEKLYPGSVVGVEQAEETTDRFTRYDIIFATRQTLCGKRLEEFSKKHRITLVLHDESHLAYTDQYLEIFQAVGYLNRDLEKKTFSILPDSPIVIGNSATAYRLDKKSLHDLFPHHVYDYSILDALRNGYWPELRAWRLKTEVDLTGVKKTKGDFDQTQLQEAVNVHERTDLIVKEWLRLDGMNKRTLVFGVGKDHARALQEAFSKHTPHSYLVLGETKDRDQIYKDFETMPRPTVLCGVEVFTTGTDFPSADFGIMARPTGSAGLAIQMIGRLARVFNGNPDTGDKKKEFFTILDVVDSMQKHRGMMTTPCIIGLHSTFDLEGQSILDANDLLEKLFAEDPSLLAAASKLGEDKLPTDMRALKTELERIALLAPENPRGATRGVSTLEWMVDDRDALLSGDLVNADAYSILVPKPMNPGSKDSEIFYRLHRTLDGDPWILTMSCYPQERIEIDLKIHQLQESLKKGLPGPEIGKVRGQLKHLKEKAEEFHFIPQEETVLAEMLENAITEADVLIRQRHPYALRLIDETSEWRRRPPSEGQLWAAKKYKINVKPEMRMGDLSRLIDRAKKMENSR